MCFPPGKKLLQTSKQVRLPYLPPHKPPQQPLHQWEGWESPVLPELEQLPRKWLRGAALSEAARLLSSHKLSVTAGSAHRRTEH